MRHFIIAAAGAACLAGGGAGAQTPASPPPSCEGEPYRAFDFWLGDWEVFTPDGAKAGENRISSEEGGCLIVERWTSAQGTTGQSYNFYDPGLEQWRQVWVSAGATIDYAGGLDETGAMALEGEIHYRNGTNFAFRGTWTENEDGSVRQRFEQYNPETEGWDDWFTGIYRTAP